jgi:hypothetical protein
MVEALRPLERRRFVETRQKAFVETIEPPMMLWACSIVKVSRAKVMTIQLSAHASSVEESLALLGCRFKG